MGVEGRVLLDVNEVGVISLKEILMGHLLWSR